MSKFAGPRYGANSRYDNRYQDYERRRTSVSVSPGTKDAIPQAHPMHICGR